MAKKRRKRRFDLVPGGSRVYRGDIGTAIENGARVRAFRRDTGEPAEGVKIRFFVVEGEVRLGSRGQKKLTRRTDEDGYAAVDLSLDARGYGLVGAEIRRRPEDSVFFSGHTSETTDALFVYTDPCVPAAKGRIVARISAVDSNGAPVEGAELSIEAANRRFDFPIEGKVREFGGGMYEGVVETNAAGGLDLLVEDQETHVLGKATLQVLPAEPRRLAIVGADDPRVAPPFDRLDLSVALLDEFGNPLDPSRISATTDAGDELPGIPVAGNAVFPVAAAGYTSVGLVISDRESDLNMETTVTFNAVWLGDPGIVFEGERFQTSLYAVPPPDRPADHATLEIRFDPELVTFEGFEQSTGGPAFETTTKVEGRTVFVDLRSEVPYSAEEFPGGIFIGTLEWSCLGEGQSCFQCVGKMSPSTPEWELCVDQKKKLDSCICIRVIYPEGNNAAKQAGIDAANQVPATFSADANVARCCPVLRVQVTDCALPQATLTARAGGNGKIQSIPQWRSVIADSDCTKDDCINITMIEHDYVSDGINVKGLTLDGDSTLDPNGVNNIGNLGAHEIGHALGLSHESAAGVQDNLMRGTGGPYPATLNSDQCKTVFQNLGDYPCS